MPEKNIYDLIIVGGGPAGLSAAIYAGRRQLNTLVLAKNIGGQMGISDQIENYPGFDFVTGFELAQKMFQQAQKWGAQFEFREVEKIISQENTFVITVGSGQEFSARAVILAFGLTSRNLEVPGEKELQGKGVTYCATCDGPLFKGKTVAVVGGGNSALESVEYLSKLASKVYLIHFKNKFTAVPALVDRVKTIDNVEFICCARVEKINGRNKLESVDLENIDDGPAKKKLELDGLFVEIGYRAKTDWLKDFVELNQSGEIISSRDGKTSRPGVFVAGDCSDSQYKQVVIAAGQGAVAALQVYNYLVQKQGKKILPDWGKARST
ncbi:MAG TPA: thioredoxin-disulfide reductase [bacterium]|nr:thioredoxin-disulfide reductase [bacterium]HNS34447.1 thioredoxin-disulfide reductase [bacterium]